MQRERKNHDFKNMNFHFVVTHDPNPKHMSLTQTHSTNPNHNPRP
jgi:hypothetical protein